MARILPAEAAIDAALALLAEGALVAMPTETVYGLAADATNGEAVARIFEAKGRPRFNPLIAHVASRAMAERFAEFDPLSRRLAEAFWPGALTLVLPLREGAAIHPLVTAGLDTVALRRPVGFAAELIERFGRPLAAPSANSSGRISPTTAAAVEADLGSRIPLIVDAGPTRIGVESTIVKVEDGRARLLRPGGIAAGEIEAVLKMPLERGRGATVEAPGMLASHYAPHAPVRLNVGEARPGEALLAFGPNRAAGSGKAAAILNLSPSGDLREAAANLFSHLLALDRSGAAAIAVEPVPHHGLGEAINDRLSRAAAPRDRPAASSWSRAMPDDANVPFDLLAERFAAIVGPRYALRSADEIAPYVHEPRGLYAGKTSLVLRPGSVEEVSRIMRLAAGTRTPIVPQSGNTGLVGAQMPRPSGGDVVLSLARLDRIREIDVRSNTITVEAGVILEKVQQAADGVDRLFPLSLAAQGTCRIGGNLSSNAGGTGVLAYGNARDLCLGVEVVLPNGEVFDDLRKLKKDNTGYDLKNLFVGAEGTLGVITAAVLKLFPKPRGREVVWAGLNSPEDALRLFNAALDRAGASLTAFELMQGRVVDFTLKHIPGSLAPLAGRHAWYVLLEISSGRSAEDARSLAEDIFAEALEAGMVEDAAIAETLAQAAAFWRLRETMPEAQKPEGGSIKHDISVPVAMIPDFIRRGGEAVEQVVPGARLVCFGHMGDGNLHFNVSQPEGADTSAYMARYRDMNAAVHAVVREFAGSISAEHGIGQAKREELLRTASPVATDLMRRVKAALDPLGIMNPGKMI